MDETALAERFETHRARLGAIAGRMLGSRAEAEDVVQEVWLRISGHGVTGVRNLDGWLTTVTARICLDHLRARAARPEQPLDDTDPPRDPPGDLDDPAEMAVLADSLGAALLVVLDTLTPAERVAFVLHDLFAVPFAEIAPIVGRSTDAAKMLASRARRRVRRAGPVTAGDLARQHAVVAAFLAATRTGDLPALLALLDPDVVARADRVASLTGAPVEVRGAQHVAGQALAFARRAASAGVSIVDGSV